MSNAYTLDEKFTNTLRNAVLDMIMKMSETSPDGPIYIRLLETVKAIVGTLAMIIAQKNPPDQQIKTTIKDRSLKFARTNLIARTSYRRSGLPEVFTPDDIH